VTVQSIKNVLYLAAFLYLVVLVIRLVLDWIQVFARDWKPRGPVLVVAVGVYALTDPPLRQLRRVLPPIRLGAVAFDLAFTALFLIVVVLMAVTSG
jgi:YggT family protein